MAYILVGTEASQFTGKARAFLRWARMDFVEQSATPEVYRDLIEPRVGFPVIPVLITPDDQLVQDTSEIMDFVEARHPSSPELRPGPVQHFASLLFELYADEWLAMAAMHYRWAYNEAWITAEMGRVARPLASAEEQLSIGRMMAERGRQQEHMLGVSEQTHSGIEAHYEGFLADFSAHLRLHPFLLGGRPTRGDFALYGPLYGPLYRDPASGAVMRRLAPLVTEWVERMSEAKSPPSGIVGGDQIPATLLPLLKRQMSEQLPELVDSVAVYGEWATVQPSGARAPRSVGDHEFIVGGRRGERQVRSVALWRLQGVLDAYAALDSDSQARADQLLDSVGGMALTTLVLPRRLERRDFRLVAV